MGNHSEMLACLPHKESTGSRRADADWEGRGVEETRIDIVIFRLSFEGR